VLEKYGALCIGAIGEAPKEGGAAPAAASAVADDDDEMQFGDMVPFGDPSWYVSLSNRTGELKTLKTMHETNPPLPFPLN